MDPDVDPRADLDGKTKPVFQIYGLFIMFDTAKY